VSSAVSSRDRLQREISQGVRAGRGRSFQSVLMRQGMSKSSKTEVISPYDGRNVYTQLNVVPVFGGICLDIDGPVATTNFRILCGLGAYRNFFLQPARHKATQLAPKPNKIRPDEMGACSSRPKQLYTRMMTKACEISGTSHQSARGMKLR
jgi:hypothetical protein